MKLLTLQSILKFTTDDLKANRDGRVSKTQFEKYKPPKISLLAVAVIMGHVLVLGGILAAIAIFTAKWQMWIVFGIVVAAALLPFVLLQNEGNIKPALRGDVIAGKVMKASGIVILTQRRGKEIYYDLYVDGITLQISASQAAAFVHEDSYSIYYLPRSLMLLSAEPL